MSIHAFGVQVIKPPCAPGTAFSTPIARPARPGTRAKASLTASITPPPPPVSRWCPHSAIHRPSGTASSSWRSTPDPMTPMMGRLTGGSLAVQIVPRPRDVVRRPAREEHLEELEEAGAEAGDRPREVEAPHPHEALVEPAGDLVAVVLEPSEPVLQGAGIVQAEILDVEDGEVRRLKQADHLAKRRRVRTGKDATRHEGTELDETIAADRMQQAAPVRSERAIHDSAEVPVVLWPDVLEHADRHERVVGADQVAIVVVDELDPVAQPFGPCPIACPRDLLGRHVAGAHRDAMASRDVQRQRTPAAAGFDDSLAGTEAQLPRDVLHLRDLGLFERRGLGREVRAGVDHFAVEPEPVEIVAQVVVMMGVDARAGRGVPAPAEPAPPGARLGHPPVTGGSTRRDEKLEQVTLDVDTAIGVGVAEVQLAVRSDEPEEGAGVGDPDPRDGRLRPVSHLLTAGQHDRDRDLADPGP